MQLPPEPMILCPACGRPVSRYGANCPHCSQPLQRPKTPWFLITWGAFFTLMTLAFFVISLVRAGDPQFTRDDRLDAQMNVLFCSLLSLCGWGPILVNNFKRRRDRRNLTPPSRTAPEVSGGRPSAR